MLHPVGPLLDKYRVGIDRENVATELVELASRSGAEATQAENENWGVVCDFVNQRWAFLPPGGTPSDGVCRRWPLRGSLYQLDRGAW